MWGNFLSRVSNAVAPSVRTPLDQFKDEWLSIRSFYIDKKVDLEGEGVPQSLNNMIQILVEEEDRLCSNNPTPLPGPCLDYFFREAILQFLCTACIRDNPRGMRKVSMAAISNLLRSTQYIPLLPHQSVQIPLSTLITSVQDIKKRRDIQNNHVSTFDEEFLALLETICLKIQEIPSCIHFFYTEQLQKEGRFPLFDCLIIHLHQNDTSGERSRQATQRLLDVAAKDYDDSFTKYILSTKFSEIVVHCTISSYTRICDSYKNQDEITTAHLNCLIFCSNILSVAPQDVSNRILAELQTKLFVGLLMPDFMSDEPLQIIQSSAFIQYYFRYVNSSTMKRLLWKLLLAGNTEPETKQDLTKHPLRNKLMNRIVHTDDRVALATLGIIGSLLELHDEEIFHNLVLRNIPIIALPSNQLVENSLKSKKWFLSLKIYNGNSTEDEKLFMAHLHDAQLGVYQSFQKTSEWLYELPNPNTPYQFEGELLFYLFKRLSTMLTNSKILNYSITELFLKLIRLPHPAMYSYFLNVDLQFPQKFKTLKSSLVELSEEILKKTESIPEFSKKLSVVYHQIAQPDNLSKYYSPPSGLSEEEMNVLSNIIIFDEFILELTALVHARATQQILIS